VQIEGETLSMTNPKALKENSRAINFGVGKELARISTDAQKAKIKADAEALAKKQAAQKAAEAAKKQGQAVMGPPKPGVPVFLPFRQGSNTPPPPPGKEWITPGKNARTY